MKSRFQLIVPLLVVVALLFTACAAPVAAPAGGDAGAADSGAPIELLYMTHNHAQSIPVNEAIIAEFQESHPNVTITFDNAPHSNYEQKVLTAFAGGEG
ncbi:MAG: extracellular solute-binding protein, partial [Caldilineaceae bacterium]|nr:extracellular solute-binding protein [Caldilineaceae bacterium]